MPTSTMNVPSHAERDSLLEQHPLRRDEYRIPTPQLQSVYAIVRDRVWMQHTGLVFYGTPRMGKTICARAVAEHLRADFPKTKVGLLIFKPKSGRPSDDHLHRLLLRSVGINRNSTRLPEVLLQQFACDVEQSLAPLGGRQFVLIVDEMQLMQSVDFLQLTALHNELDGRGIHMTTIGFAQIEILHTRSAFQTTDQLQIIGRFLTDAVPFKGCSGEADLRTILTFYDTGSDFPEGSGWSYTAFFIPQAFVHGVRLAAVSAMLWELLSEAIEGRAGAGVPMEHMCLTVKYLLMALRRKDSALLTIETADLQAAVSSSGLVRFIGGLGNGREAS